MKSTLTWIVAMMLAWSIAMPVASAQTESEKQTQPAKSETDEKKAQSETTDTQKPDTQETDTEKTEPKSDVENKAAEVTPDTVLATVNGEKITEGEFDALFESVVKRQSGGQNIPPQIRQQFRKQLRPRLIKTLVDDKLLTDSAEKAGIEVTEGDMRADLKADLDAYLLRSGTTAEEFEKQIQRGEFKTISEFIDNRIKEPAYANNAVHMALLESKYADKLNVTDEEIKARYDRDKERIYTHPAKVRASHILILSKESDDPEKREAALAKANEVLELAKKDDADFAALAREHSEGPSKTEGGDLGFFPRTGAMVEPFAAAAFGLKKGEISDVVETQFGFHVIKVTDRKEEEVVSLEAAKSAIKRELRMEKIGELRETLLAELRESAKIEYAEGVEAAG